MVRAPWQPGAGPPAADSCMRPAIPVSPVVGPASESRLCQCARDILTPVAFLSSRSGQVIHEDRLFVFGGLGESDFFNDLHVLDLVRAHACPRNQRTYVPVPAAAHSPSARGRLPPGTVCAAVVPVYPAPCRRLGWIGTRREPATRVIRTATPAICAVFTVRAEQSPRCQGAVASSDARCNWRGRLRRKLGSGTSAIPAGATALRRLHSSLAARPNAARRPHDTWCRAARQQ